MARRRSGRLVLGAIGWLACAIPAALAQDVPPTPPPAAEGRDTIETTVPESIPEWMARLLPDPNDPALRAYAERQRERRATELALIRHRAEYFREGSPVERRQVGLALLRERYASPEYYALLLEVFGASPDDVKHGVFDMFADAGTDEGDAALAWAAVFDNDADDREAAGTRLDARAEGGGARGEKVKLVVGGGLQQEHNGVVASAAGLAEKLNIVEMVPLLIGAQVAGGGGSGENERTGNLGYIVVATQQAFVSDLQPVVSDSAVAFDPTLSVVTEGVVLEVKDAVVLTYRTEVHGALVRMTSRALGASTEGLGYDERAWASWYNDQWRPYLASLGG